MNIQVPHGSERGQPLRLPEVNDLVEKRLIPPWGHGTIAIPIDSTHASSILKKARAVVFVKNGIIRHMLNGPLVSMIQRLHINMIHTLKSPNSNVKSAHRGLCETDLPN
jgi:hypothetical protein